MKKIKRLLTSLLIFMLTGSVFLGLAPRGYAQTDQGWTAPVNLSLSGAASNPVMVVDSRGFIHAVWLDDVEGYQYSESRDNGRNWSAPQVVNFPFRPKDPPPVLLPGPNGSIHVFWVKRDEPSPDKSFVNQRLFYGQATPGDLAYPKNWILNYPLADAVMSFDVVVDIKGALHVAYIQGKLVGDKPAGVYYIQSPSAGGYWISPRLLYQSGYFRSAKQEDLYVRVNSSDTPSGQKIFVSWDNRAIKRVFLAESQDDTGLAWNAAKQILGPDDSGFDSVFNLTVASYGNNLLLVWQLGKPGLAQCTVYSQWSEDGGYSWGEPVAVLGGRSECPVSVKVVGKNGNYFSVMLIGQVNSLLVAWNGTQWSDVQSQAQLPSFANPDSLNAVLLGCRSDILNKDRLYVIGCDQSDGRDVWFMSRTLESVENWFSPSEAWEESIDLSIESEDQEKITDFTSIADEAGNIHAVWVQSPDKKGASKSIEYARWNGAEWTVPEIVMSNEGSPLQLSLTTDHSDRLLLSWVDGYNGNLDFSWANLERANFSSEWESPIDLPVPSRLVNASDGVVDGSGRVIYAYSISVNEERGVYITQSIDSGRSWSSPIKVFDAVLDNWERVEQPRISIGKDGVLHLIFLRSNVREGQSAGLYYSRSLDGGITWSDVQVLSEGEIMWSDIVSYTDQTVHVVWQEYDGLVFSNVSQVSTDNGATWGKQNDVTGVNENSTPVSMVSGGRGLLHFIQLVSDRNPDEYNQKTITLQDWKWNGTNWELDFLKKLAVDGKNVTYSLSANVTSTGFLCAFIPVEYSNSDNTLNSEILTFSRFIGDVGSEQTPAIPVIPASGNEANGSMTSGVSEEETTIFQLTPTPDFSILYNDNVTVSPLRRNIAGLVLTGVGVFATIFLLLWRRPANRK